MTPEEFEAVRLRLGITPAKLAASLGVTRATVYNLIAGRVPVRPAMANLVTWLAALRDLDPNHPAIPPELRPKGPELGAIRPELRSANDNTPAGKERAA